MANTNKLWKGAVEPPETSPSGNQYDAWKGAVEPVGAVAAGQTVGRGLVNAGLKVHRPKLVA